MSEDVPLLQNSPQKSQAKDLQNINESAEDGVFSSQKQKTKDVKTTNLRWVILALAILTNYGSFYCYDTPQPLQFHIQEIFGIQDTKFNMLYSVVLIPNILIPFFGGIVMDYLGIRMTMIISGLTITTGQLIATVGAVNYSFDLILLGRCVYGVGQQTIENSLLLMISKWFWFKDLSLAWGIARAILRTSSALSSFLNPKLYNATGNLSVPFAFGLGLMTFSLLCVFAVTYLDKKADASQPPQDEAANAERIVLSDIKNLSKLYYLILVIGVLSYMSFLGYTNNVNNLLVSRFGFNSENAGKYITIIYLVAGVFSPLVGFIVDRVGRRAYFMFVAIVINLFSNLFFLLLEDTQSGFPNNNVIIGFVGFGIFYALFATTYWPSLAIIVPKILGTATGIVTCSQAITQSIFPAILGVVHDNSVEFHHGYYYTQVLHCGVMMLVLLTVIWTYFEDVKTGGKLRNEKSEVKKD